MRRWWKYNFYFWIFLLSFNSVCELLLTFLTGSTFCVKWYILVLNPQDNMPRYTVVFLLHLGMQPPRLRQTGRVPTIFLLPVRLLPPHWLFVCTWPSSRETRAPSSPAGIGGWGQRCPFGSYCQAEVRRRTNRWLPAGHSWEHRNQHQQCLETSSTMLCLFSSVI